MKTFCLFLAVVCLSAVIASGVNAADFMAVTHRDGVEVSIQYDPFGPNNAIVAHVRFINTNPYRVEVDWQPIITCEDDSSREGAAAGLSIDEGATTVVNIWRLSACGQAQMKDFAVRMKVKKAGS